MDTKGRKVAGGGGGGGVMNWVIGIDMYTLICIKQITNENLLYQKINKILKKNKKTKQNKTKNSTLFIGLLEANMCGYSTAFRKGPGKYEA